MVDIVRLPEFVFGIANLVSVPVLFLCGLGLSVWNSSSLSFGPYSKDLGLGLMVGRMELELEEDEEDQELKMSDTMSEAAVMLLDKGNLNTLFRIFLLRSPEPKQNV